VHTRAPLCNARAMLKRDGFFVVQSGVSEAEANFISTQVRSHHKATKKRAETSMRMQPSLASAVACLHNSTPLHAAMSSVFGGVGAYRATPRADYAVDKVKGWHRDLQMLDAPGDIYFRSVSNRTSSGLFGTGPDGESQLMVVAVMYLQDHTTDDRALTLRVGTHRPALCCRPHGACPSRAQAVDGHAGWQASKTACHNEASEVTLHPRLGDIILMDYNVVHRSSSRMMPGGRERVIFTMGYHAQDNMFSDAADRYYALQEAAFQGLCSAHAFASRSWTGCVREAAQSDLRREPLPTRAQRCDPSRSPSEPGTPRLRPGCPVATVPFELNSRQYQDTRLFLAAPASAPRASAHKQFRHVAQGTRRVVVVGASRGIGLELARQYAVDGDSIVHATTRSPAPEAALAELIAATGGRVVHEQLDVTDGSHLERLKERFDTSGVALDLLIHSAAMTQPNGPDALERSMRTNTDAPLAVAEALLPSLRRSKASPTLLCILTSPAASHKRTAKYCKPKRQNCSAVLRPYLVSKQALNDRFRVVEPAWRADGITAILMDPGWVKTEGGGPGAQIEVQESARGMRQVMRGLTAAASGQWLSYNGNRPTW
jgi:NAD(P)-dependent dehydrogenase (short-subunit alcohol dehydrogenase family)